MLLFEAIITFVNNELIFIVNNIYDNINNINIIYKILDFDILHVLPADTFVFGGQTGNTVTQLVLQKK